MTEQEWRVCVDPIPMLEFLLTQKAGHLIRKKHLLLSAVWHHSAKLFSSDQEQARAIWRQESLVDSQDDRDEADKAIAELLEFLKSSSILDPSDLLKLTLLLKDIFGPTLFRTTHEREWLKWRSQGITELAQGIYTTRSFDLLANLAGLLEVSGCQDQEILQHLLDRGLHVRGCWVVDLILGKG